MANHPQVIVAGAGPVGLLTALALARQDIPVLVLEAEPGLTRDLRAGTYHPPSLEMMAPYGITDEMHKTAIKVPRWQIRDRKEGVIVDWDVSLIRELTPYPYRLHLEQHRLTPIIHSKLRECPNAEVRFSHEVTDFSQTADKVVVTAKTPGGMEKLEAHWLVGADGGRSTVRKCMGVAFDGYTWPERFLVASTTYDYEPHGYRLNTYVADPENSRLWHISGGRARALDLGFPPFDVVVESPTTVIVADNEGRRIVRYDLSSGVADPVVE